MQRLDFNTGWHFSCPDGRDFDVTLPHDAMLNTPRNTEPGFTWFLLAGWRGNDYTYTKNLHITSELINKHLVLEFEGVYCMTTVTVNDRPAAEKAYGYTPFTVELDGLLREGDNTIEVTAHVPQDGHNRWYTGGGIYRPVHLLVGEDAYIHALDTTRPTTLCPSVHWLREYLDGTPYLTTDEDEWMRDDPERKKSDWMHYASIFRSAVNNLPDNEKGQVYPETYIRMDEDATKNLYPYLDIAGYNYYEDRYEVLHKLHPERVLLGTETRHTMLPDTMKFAKTHPYLIGDFVWTLQSHLGEINCCDLHYEENEEHKSYPWVTNHGGVLDLTGQAEPSLHRYEFIWGGFLDKPVHALYLASQPPVHNGKPPIATSYRWTDTVDGWTYEGYEGKRTFVDAYTDADSVEIFINGKSAGKAQVKDYFAKIPCIYEPGELVGVGYDADGHEIYRTSVRTADAETVLTVKTDKNILRAGGQDFCFADVYVTDKNGTVKLLPDYDVKIEVVGAASLQGYGSAAYKNAEHYDQHHHKSWQGHLQAVLRSTEKTGPVTVTFTADGCAPAILHLSAE